MVKYFVENEFFLFVSDWHLVRSNLTKTLFVIPDFIHRQVMKSLLYVNDVVDYELFASFNSKHKINDIFKTLCNKGCLQDGLPFPGSFDLSNLKAGIDYQLATGGIKLVSIFSSRTIDLESERSYLYQIFSIFEEIEQNIKLTPNCNFWLDVNQFADQSEFDEACKKADLNNREYKSPCDVHGTDLIKFVIEQESINRSEMAISDIE